MEALPLVLVVDDSPDTRLVYSDYLEDCAFRVLTAEDGEEAVRIAKNEWPAAIVMDPAMPHVDGCEAIRRLRADPMTADIPISGHVTSGGCASAASARLRTAAPAGCRRAG